MRGNRPTQPQSCVQRQLPLTASPAYIHPPAPRHPLTHWLRVRLQWVLLLLLAVNAILVTIARNPAALTFFIPTVSAHGFVAQDTPNRFNPRNASTSVQPHSQAAAPTSTPPPSRTPVSIHRKLDLPMAPATIALHAGQAAIFHGSDGRLEVDVPATAVSATDVAAAGGSLNLKITQIAPASGSSAGGSGRISFGTYLLQVVDSKGNRVATGLSAPVTMKYHPDSAGHSALNFSNVFAVFNGAVPSDLQLAPLASTSSGSSATSPGAAPTNRGPVTSQKATLNTTDGSLVVTAALSAPSTTLTWNTFAPVATFGSPDPFNVNLNAGALTSTLPIQLPPGPGGFTPPLTLSYTSAAVNEQHNPQGAADWVGEGWSLALGSITWAEHNTVPPSCGTCGNGWESNWEITDPYGTGTELIPPNISVATFWDDTPNVYCQLVNNSCQSYPNYPVTWHTANETYAKIISYVGSINLNQKATPPCFRVWLTNGVM